MNRAGRELETRNSARGRLTNLNVRIITINFIVLPISHYMMFRPKPKCVLSESNGQQLGKGTSDKYSKSRCVKGWVRDMTVFCLQLQTMKSLHYG